MSWIPPMQEIKFVTVKQMYAFAQTNQIKLLSNYSAEFWAEYNQNYAHYDRLFNRYYKNFYYFNQDANLDVEDVLPDFVEDVYNLLLMNSKRYSELYRVHVVDDTKYSILDNYDVTETKEGETSRTVTDAFGAKTETANGSIDVTDAFGAKTETATGSKDITDVFGQRIVTDQSTIGSQANTSVEKVAPYDSETFSNDNRAETTLGQRQDSGTKTQNSVTDTHDTDTTNSTSYSAHSDTHGTESENSVTHSAHSDTHTHEGEDSYTLSKKGNIGVQTQTEVMEKHTKFWKGYNFYKIIFDDICKELLLIDHGYI